MIPAESMDEGWGAEHQRRDPVRLPRVPRLVAAVCPLDERISDAIALDASK